MLASGQLCHLHLGGHEEGDGRPALDAWYDLLESVGPGIRKWLGSYTSIRGYVLDAVDSLFYCLWEG